ncbi:hypothetical protein QT06_C0001G0704 [archaeon GW2011_AR15]|nr:hypothetical protein QT06_C0001G0704 [archaeon GW2011_AR15]MBS3103509.1 hypothetical protein [Candidatus Woesearchaeota archaeon]
MAKKNDKGMLGSIGPWAFFFGLLIAVAATFAGQVFWMLGVLGLVVGLMNITEKELSLYLLASLTFLLSANALSVTLTRVVGVVPFVSSWITFIDPLLANVTLFVAPGAAVVALKALYVTSKN